MSEEVIYSVRVCIHRWRRLLFHDAIWHALVLGAAGLHYAAILYGVVLVGRIQWSKRRNANDR